MSHTINSARTAAVATDIFWQPILPETPRNVRCLCINKPSGIAQVCVIFSDEKYFTHWAPLPKWRLEQ